MLKAVGVINNRRTVFFGLDRENTNRMHQGQPIVVDLQALLADHLDAEVQDLILFAGETVDACAAELSQYVDLPTLEDE